MAIVYYNKYNEVTLYEGDKTTNGCGLSKKDVDLNFFNLRKSDVKTSYWDANKRVLTIELFDGKKINVGNIDPYNLRYEEDTNTVYGITPDGVKFEITSGVYTDSTLEGDNKTSSPISIAKSQRTGFHEPVLGIVESKDEADANGINGGRYILKTKESTIGRVYTADEVALLDKYLKEINSEWRVATLSDWNELLNAVEPCEEDRNYGDTNVGRTAGEILKDNHLWDGYNSYGFSIIPIDNEAIYLTGNIARKFTEKSNIETISSPMGFIRLVKDNDFHENERIFGEVYNCVKMPTWDKDFKTPRIWTAVNVNVDYIYGKEIGTSVITENDYSYYIIEGDFSQCVGGDKSAIWDQFKLKLGDSVFCIKDNTTYTLIQNKDGKYALESTNDIVNSSIVSSYYDSDKQTVEIVFKDNSQIPSISLNVAKLVNDIAEAINDSEIQLTDSLANEAKKREEKDAALEAAIYNLNALLEISNNLTDGSIDALNKYFGNLKKEDERQQGEIDELAKQISDEVKNRSNADTKLTKRIKELEDIVALIDVAGDISSFKKELEKQLSKEFDKIGAAQTAEDNAKKYTDSKLAKYATSADTEAAIAKAQLKPGQGVSIDKQVVSVKVSDNEKNALHFAEDGSLEVIVSTATTPVVADNVSDVVYDKDNQYIYLIDKDGAKIGEGFDASGFVTQSVIKDVVLSGDTLIFVFPAPEGGEDIIREVELNQLIGDEVIAEIKKGLIHDVRVNGVSCVQDGIADIKLNVYDENKERAIAGALNYIWKKMMELHPGLNND